MYTRINKHDPERDIGKLLRRQEVLRYLDKSHQSPSTSAPGDHNTEAHYKISKDCSDRIDLSTFVTVPRGAAPDPAKKVYTIDNTAFAQR